MKVCPFISQCRILLLLPYRGVNSAFYFYFGLAEIVPSQHFALRVEGGNLIMGGEFLLLKTPLLGRFAKIFMGLAPLPALCASVVPSPGLGGEKALVKANLFVFLFAETFCSLQCAVDPQHETYCYIVILIY